MKKIAADRNYRIMKQASGNPDLSTVTKALEGAGWTKWYGSDGYYFSSGNGVDDPSGYYEIKVDVIWPEGLMGL